MPGSLQRPLPARPSLPPTTEQGINTRANAHRPALDGVRGVAVLAVIAYHVGTGLDGGFLGVDIFFVLSGYLITSLLLNERAGTGRVRLRRFWARRARRLLPAVLLLVTAIALWTAQTGEFSSFAARRADLLSTIFYYANWHLNAVNESYFALYASGASPLEHMWSLSIEEQFYLVWPALLGLLALLFGSRGRTLIVALVLGSIASAAWMAILYTPINPMRAYVGTDARASELLIGAALATLLFKYPDLLKHRRVRPIVTWFWPLVAIAVVLAFVAMTDQASFYYRGGAFIFCAIVAAGIFSVESLPESPLGRFLSLRPLRWVGVISYGLYLWHWPIYQWVVGANGLGGPELKKVLVILITFAVASLSFYLVESPIRSGGTPWLRLSVPRLALVLSIAVLGVTGLVIRSTQVQASASSLLSAVRAGTSGARNCPPGSPAPAPSFVWCRRATATQAGAPTVAVIGDSTAGALNPGMQRLATSRGWGYVQANRNSCSALPLMFPAAPQLTQYVAQAEQCVAGTPRLLNDVVAKVRPDIWLIADRQLLYALRETNGRVLMPGDAQRESIITAAMAALLRRLTATGSRVIIAVTPPQAPPLECATASSLNLPRCSSVTTSVKDPQTALARTLVTRVAASMKGTVAAVDVDDVVCPYQGRCPALVGGTLVRFDRVHYTPQFSVKIVPIIFARAQAAGIVLKH